MTIVGATPEARRLTVSVTTQGRQIMMRERPEERFPELDRRIEGFRIDLRKVSDGVDGAELALRAGDPQAAWQCIALTHYPIGRLVERYKEVLAELEALGAGPPPEEGEE